MTQEKQRLDASENTPRAFIDYIKNNTFDRTSLREWEKETLSSLLNIPRKNDSSTE